jgi:hypothetical protein
MAGGGATVNGGARRKRHWGAPTDAGTAPGRRRAAGEHDDGPPGRRGRLDAAAELRRGRLVDVVHGKPNKPHQEVPYLTAKLRSGTTGTGRRRRCSSTAARHGIGGDAGDLGFGRRVKTARVLGAQAALSVFK